MRGILFRGKRADNGEWVYGYYIVRKVWQSTVHVIRTEDNGFDSYNEYEVDPETIGQFTGLTDCASQEIFEGDICDYGSHTGFVKYDEEDARFELTLSHIEETGFVDVFGKELAVIGNIHDNPELLEVQDD